MLMPLVMPPVERDGDLYYDGAIGPSGGIPLDAALETSLAEGLRLERHVFAALFDTADQKEGMAAFREKREPRFTQR